MSVSVFLCLHSDQLFTNWLGCTKERVHILRVKGLICCRLARFRTVPSFTALVLWTRINSRWFDWASDKPLTLKGFTTAYVYCNVAPLTPDDLRYRREALLTIKDCGFGNHAWNTLIVQVKELTRYGIVSRSEWTHLTTHPETKHITLLGYWGGLLSGSVSRKSETFKISHSKIFPVH